MDFCSAGRVGVEGLALAGGRSCALIFPNSEKLRDAASHTKICQPPSEGAEAIGGHIGNRLPFREWAYDSSHQNPHGDQSAVSGYCHRRSYGVPEPIGKSTHAGAEQDSWCPWFGMHIAPVYFNERGPVFKGFT
jgi:hypothetical protein